MAKPKTKKKYNTPKEVPQVSGPHNSKVVGPSNQSNIVFAENGNVALIVKMQDNKDKIELQLPNNTDTATSEIAQAFIAAFAFENRK